MEEGRVAVEDRSMNRALLLFNCTLLSVGTSGGPLITRLYFLHGGKHVWLSSFLQSAGFPIILIPLAISYFRRRRHSAPAELIFMKLPLFVASAIIGIITGLINYLYAYGLARLPVSTSSLIIATQLAFTAGFAFLLVRQKFTAYSVNAVVLLTIGAAILALRSSGDRPAGESTKRYVLGFVMTLVAAALNGFVLPLVEWVYKNTRQPITYTLVMEIQLILCLFATLFCTLGMLINNDLKVIGREARDYELGKTKYWVLLVGTAIIWQNFFLGAIGVVFCASSLLSGILVALVLPVTEVLAVILYKEKFQAEKIVALVVSLWGFVSYFWGEIQQSREKRQNPTPEIDLPQTLPDR